MDSLTLEVEDGVLRAAKELANARGTTVEAMVREYLAAEVLRAVRERANKRLLSVRHPVDGPITWTRDELYGR